jgi:hypothetical protein
MELTLEWQRILPLFGQLAGARRAEDFYLRKLGWADAVKNPFGGTATIRPLMAEYRFIGNAADGMPAGAMTRIQRDRSVGKSCGLSRQPGQLPPSKRIGGPHDLTGLAGRGPAQFGR